MFAVVNLFRYLWRLPRYEAKCVAVCNAGASDGGRSFCVPLSRERSYPWRYIDTTRKAIDCATTLPL